MDNWYKFVKLFKFMCGANLKKKKKKLMGIDFCGLHLYYLLIPTNEPS